MKRSEEILKKVTTQGIADYLLGVESKKRESINCDERLENAISEFEAVVKKHDDSFFSPLSDAGAELRERVAEIYLEIGIKAGFLLAKELLIPSSDMLKPKS